MIADSISGAIADQNKWWGGHFESGTSLTSYEIALREYFSAKLIYTPGGDSSRARELYLAIISYLINKRNIDPKAIFFAD